MNRPRKLKVPAPFAQAQEHDEKARYALMRVVDDCLKWPCVREEMWGWATSVTNANCGWAEYGYAQDFLRALGEAERRRANA